MKTIVVIFIFSLILFFGCSTFQAPVDLSVSANYKNSNSEVQISGKINSVQGLQETTRFIAINNVQYDPAISQEQKSNQVNILSQMPNYKVVIESTGYRYPGSSQQTVDMELDSKLRYLKSKLK